MFYLIVLASLIIGFISLFIFVEIELKRKKKENKKYEKYMSYYTNKLNELNVKIEKNMRVFNNNKGD